MFNRMTQQSNQQWVEQRDLRTNNDQNSVEVYFINYLLVDKEGENKGRLTAPVIGNDGRVRYMPPLGESIVLPQRVAEHIQKRLSAYNAQTNTTVPAFTRNGATARAIREAFDNDRLSDLEKSEGTFEGIMKQSALEGMSDEELQKEIERRKEEASAPKKTDSKTKKK